MLKINANNSLMSNELQSKRIIYKIKSILTRSISTHTKNELITLDDQSKTEMFIHLISSSNNDKVNQSNQANG